MVQEFIYTDKKGTNNRKVFVLKEDDNYIEGVDLNLLSEDEVNNIKSALKDYKVVSISNKDKIEGWNLSWNKGYRKFKKSSMNNHE